jgi:hypothetical protein
MLNISQKNKAIYLLYSERSFASGITITARVYDNTNVQISGSPFTLVELAGLGLYGITFTPTVSGDYKVLVYEGTTKMSSAFIKVTDYDIESVGTDTTSILTILQNATYGLSALNTDIDAIYNYLVNTIQIAIANVQTGVTTLIADVENATYGLSALKTLIDANQVTLTTSLSTISGKADTIIADTQNATYGLAVLKTTLNTVVSRLNDIEGTGFSTTTDSLKAISTKISSLTNRTGGYVS